MGLGSFGLFLLIGIGLTQHKSHGCQIEGVFNWLVPTQEEILDTQRGVFFSRDTSNILGINSVTITAGLNGGPYIAVSLANSELNITTTDAFEQYEENETAQQIGVTVILNCLGGSTVNFILQVNIKDTNNNAPQFRPRDNYEFTIAPPVPPGFRVTDCINDIMVRDIDLTTSAIIFNIEPNDYFEIEYEDSTTSKEFNAILRTTTFIRNIPEPITLWITATDVDDTGDPPLTTNATLRISGDTQFALPDDLIFSRTFYFAQYTADNAVELQENIYLVQGYHEEVQFNLTGEYALYFELVRNVNQVSFRVASPVPTEVFREREIYLAVRADREFISGTSATVILQLPEEENLEFDQALYEGLILYNTLQLSQLVLSQGYGNEPLSISIVNEHSSFFTASVQDSMITLTMVPLTTAIIEENNAINLKVIASTSNSAASTIVALDIIKDDHVTPVFDQILYNGTYDPIIGLEVAQIIMIQGYDDTVRVFLSGEYSTYFNIVQDGTTFSLNTPGLPQQILSEQHLLLKIQATKPRTVGATAVIHIALPAARELSFEAFTYSGTLESNVLSLENIVLTVGYDDNVIFELTGDYANSFIVSHVNNVVSINLLSQLPENSILENSHIALILRATGSNAVPATVPIFIEIIKDDLNTPLFDKSIYNGTYDQESGLNVENISITQGYDDTVNVTLEGEYAGYFELKQEDNVFNIAAISELPSQAVIVDNIILLIEATKPWTVGARAVVSIALPAARELRFDNLSYKGSIDTSNNTLILDTIILSVGYEEDVIFNLLGDSADYFTVSNFENEVTIELITQLPENVILDNNVVILTLLASGINSVPTSTTIALRIIKEDINTPVFSQNIYEVIYINSSQIDIPLIQLIQGYDSSVSFNLQGDHAQYFNIVNEENIVTIDMEATIPDELIFDEKVLLFNILAVKPMTVGAYTTVSVKFPPVLIEPAVMTFSQNTYIGTLESDVLSIDNLVIENGYTPGTDFLITGEFAHYFILSSSENIITITLANTANIESLRSHKFVLLEIEARRKRAVSTFTTVIVDVIEAGMVILPVFDRPFYGGLYSKEYGLQFDEEISLILGYDDTVTFALEGENAEWFTVIPENNSVRVIENATNIVPDHIFNSNNHILFTIVAQKPATIGGRAAISIEFVKESNDLLLLGFENISYMGSINQTVLELEPITLNEGYTANVIFSLHGDLASYFTWSSEGPVVAITMQGSIPEDSIPRNRIIVLELRASAPESLPAFATIILNVLRSEISPMETPLVFSQTYYTGQYTEASGLVFEQNISLATGFDDSIEFALEGDSSIWFDLSVSGNSVSLVLTDPIPAAVLANNQKLLFVVRARRSDTLDASSTVVISLTEDLTNAALLGFEHISYSGSINDTVLELAPITLNEGYTANVVFSLHGDLASYLTWSSEGPVVAITMQGSIPEDSIPRNRIIVLELRASAPESLPAFATIILNVLRSEISPMETPLVFSQTYYTGQYTEASGLVFEQNISLATGFDDSIEFALEGDSSIWFDLSVSGNSVSLVLTDPIPAAVLANNQKLLFVVRARRSDTLDASSTIVISLTEDLTNAALLGFEHISYTGSINDTVLELAPITLNEGYTANVVFSLHGDLASYFTWSSEGPVVAITMQGSIPEDSIPRNRIIVLELRASAPESLPAFATIILNVLRSEISPMETPLVFSQTYYTGQYTEASGLVFEQNISLATGFDDSIEFALEGDSSIWFDLSVSGNSVSLVLTDPIPAAVLANNQKLLFVVRAHRSDTLDASSTIVISLTEDLTNAALLGFEHISYTGSINDTVLELAPITLNEGYTANVVFSLHGDLASYFTWSSEGPVVAITMQGSIPEDSIPRNRIIVLELRASAPESLPAFATIILNVLRSEISPMETPLVFSQTYYTGEYTDASGLVFEQNISLATGFDDSIEFALEGDSSIWFDLSVSGNSVSLVLTDPIPAAVLANNQKLLFVVRARRSDTLDASSTIVISLTEDLTNAALLGFEHISYTGSINDTVLELAPITLNEGYTANVVFSLHGDLASYFTWSSEGPVVAITMQGSIPEDSIPRNRIIVLELRASAPESLPAFATIILNVLRSEISPMETPLVFSQTYYTGQYTEASGLVFEQNISLATGFDDSIEFALEGDSSIWFDLSVSGNSVSLVLTDPIPAAVLANNQKLLFVVRAHRSDTLDASSTIVISLTEDLTNAALLGFEHISYTGSINDTVLELAPITLNEGYTANVVFSLHGDLASYFTWSSEGPVVAITMQGSIPEDSIPRNRIIVLELRASAPESLPAFATIILNVLRSEISPMETPLVFSQTYYTGEYTDASGLVFEQNISLATGFDDSIEFALEGDSSIWFDLSVSGNSVSLVLTDPIPAAVLANNQKLLFVVRARRSNTLDASSTVVISLTEDLTNAALLGFEHISYTGSINDTVLELAPITLNEGYTANVVFSLHGDLASYFTWSSEGPVVAITMQGSIPEDSIPRNRIIVLELRASAPESLPAFATIILNGLRSEISPMETPLVFSQTYYTGQYTEASGLVFEQNISLATGFDDSIEFALEGDSSIWFDLSVSGNSVSLVLTDPIPAAVLANNQKLLFVVRARRSNTLDASSTVVISLTEDLTNAALLGFEHISYSGSINDTVLELAPITLNEGYTANVVFSLHGDLASYFTWSSEGPVVAITMQGSIPEDSIPRNRIIVLELRASAPESLPAFATIILNVLRSEISPMETPLVFSQTYYTGQYTEASGLVFEQNISLATGFDDSIEFALEGDSSIWFDLSVSGNSVSLVLTDPIPAAVLANNQKLLFVVRARRSDTLDASSTIVISLTEDLTNAALLGFEHISYSGSINDTVLELAPITLNEGYTANVVFSLHGDLASYFTWSSEGPVVAITMQGSIPEDSIPRNRIIVLELRASAPESLPAFATIILNVLRSEISPMETPLVFSQTYYTGEYTDASGLVFEQNISLATGFDDSIEFALEGDSSIWFDLSVSGNSVSLVLTDPIPAAVLANNQKLLFVVRARRSNTLDASSTVVISLTEDLTNAALLGFEHISYTGSINDTVLELAPITLNEGYTANVVFSLHGDLASYFTWSSEGPVVAITMQGSIPEDSIPRNRIIVLELRASAPESLPAFATIILNVLRSEISPMETPLVFSQTYYTGQYTEASGLVFEQNISLATGFDDSIEFALEGDSSIWFDLSVSGNSVSLVLTDPIPAAVLANNQKLLFVVRARRSDTVDASSTIVISLTEGTDIIIFFERVLYNGNLRSGLVFHEAIRITGPTVPNIRIVGEYSELFEANSSDGSVTVQTVNPAIIPQNVTHIAVELHADNARAVLLLDIIDSESPVLPSVTFSSSSYVINVKITSTGTIGQVLATADNGETINYSVILDDVHLQERLSINGDGELHLSAPAASGVHSLLVVATTVITRANATATVVLTVEAITVCGTELVVPPLIILDRDEESPHRNLVVLDQAQYGNCQFSLNNHWPLNQTWLYVDENGLHANRIDREDESIAFMTVSQVQVELILECTDDVARTKRSLTNNNIRDQNYDYGSNKWVLTDSILYNARRSLVNLIINDINDNAPIFVGKDNEPIAVGYPVPELETIVLPRALAEIKATDADIGENAALLYWSSEQSLAVSPHTGFVHVRNNARLENDAPLTVYATDRNGDGLTGSLNLVVKLLDLNHIAVVSIRDGFLDHEQNILGNLSQAVGYDIKTIRTKVITESTASDDENESSRKKRDTSSTGATLQLYVYGLVEREPVDVSQLTSDINNNNLVTVNIARTVSLEDHLEGQEICTIPGRDTGLLVATIVLSVFLFVLILGIALSFFLTWKEKQNYNQFSDENSLASRNESFDEVPKPENITKPRINIEELRRSERRLQEMLDAPDESESSETTPPIEEPLETIINISPPDPQLPIVIQSIDKLKDITDESDDDDEFGETKKPKRKSVVTFNENVEKIIHLEDTDTTSQDLEIFSL